MTGKERVLSAITKKAPDCIPTFCGRIDDIQYWLNCSGCKNEEELRTLWGLDLRKTSYGNIFNTSPGKTIWGCEDAWDKGYNSAKNPPLCEAASVKTVEQHNWPSLQNIDFDLLVKRTMEMDNQYALVQTLGFQPVFGTLNDLFGMENSMVYMHTEPDLIDAAIARIEAFLLESMQKAIDLCGKKVQFFWLGDDFSTQRGMMISPQMWRRFLKPCYKKLFELVKSSGLLVWFHSCGSFRPVMGELIDIGMDVWETVQAHLVGNDPIELKNLYGNHVTFFGAINCQQTLPYGSEEDVRKEVRERISVFGKNGGYILGPDHSLQKNIPAQNVFAMYDEVKKCAAQ